MKKIFFFDIDGTIYHNHKLSKRVIDAIHNIQGQGDLCFIASGRPPTFIPPEIKDIGFDGYVLANGGYVSYHQSIIFEAILEYDALYEILQYLKVSGNEYILQTKDACYLNKDYQKILNFFIGNEIDVEKFVYDFDEEEIMKKTIKIEVWPKNEIESKYLMNTFTQYTWHQYDLTNMEFYSNTISKASGIDQVIQHLGLLKQDTYCFGDDFNDIEMFKSVQHSYAMDNAHKDVKSQATHICPSVQDDGVAQVLETFIR